MNQPEKSTKVFLCPMHPDVRQSAPGKCPKCNMDLLPEGTRFGMLRHLSQNPVMVVVMIAVMVAIMAALMMMRR